MTCGPYPEPIKTSVLLPIIPAGFDKPVCIMVAGASTRLPLHESYRAFYSLLASSVTAVVANGIALVQARRRAESLAELDRPRRLSFPT